MACQGCDSGREVKRGGGRWCPMAKSDKEQLGNDERETKTKVKTKDIRKANDEGRMKLNPVIFLPMMTGPREDR